MTVRVRATGRSWRVCVAAAVAGVAALAPASYAEPDCGPTVEPVQVDTLSVSIGRVASPLRVDGTTPVEVAVRRDAPAGGDQPGMEGAHVSLRVRTRDMTSFVDATLDATGRSTVLVTLDQRTKPGPAVIVADVWADNAPQYGCQQLVREHGYGETAAHVSR